MHTKIVYSTLGQLALTVIATAMCVAPGHAKAQTPFSIQTKWVIGGEGGWDYLAVDPQMHRLYVTHGTRVEVLDTSTGKVTRSISGLKGTHGVAFDSDGKFGYISDGGANEVVVFDRTSLEKVGSVAAGTGSPRRVRCRPARRAARRRLSATRAYDPVGGICNA